MISVSCMQVLSGFTARQAPSRSPSAWILAAERFTAVRREGGKEQNMEMKTAAFRRKAGSGMTQARMMRMMKAAGVQLGRQTCAPPKPSACAMPSVEMQLYRPQRSATVSVHPVCSAAMALDPAGLQDSVLATPSSKSLGLEAYNRHVAHVWGQRELVAKMLGFYQRRTVRRLRLQAYIARQGALHSMCRYAPPSIGSCHVHHAHDTHAMHSKAPALQLHASHLGRQLNPDVLPQEAGGACALQQRAHRLRGRALQLHLSRQRTSTSAPAAQGDGQLHIALSRAAAEAVLKQCSTSPGLSAHSGARPPDGLVCGGQGLSCLQVCTHCGTNWNRDINAARNMVDIVTALVEGLQLDEAFQRPAAGTKRPRQQSRRPPPLHPVPQAQEDLGSCVHSCCSV